MALQRQMFTKGIGLILAMRAGQQMRCALRQAECFSMPMKAIKRFNIRKPLFCSGIIAYCYFAPTNFFNWIFGDNCTQCFAN